MGTVDGPANTPAAIPLTALNELRGLGQLLRQLDVSATEAEWVDEAALADAIAMARSELATRADATAPDIAASSAAPQWLDRLHDATRAAETTRNLTATPTESVANAVVAVNLARSAVAEAVLAVAAARGTETDMATPARFGHVWQAPAALPDVGRRAVAEIRHVFAERPRAVLLRIVITLGVALSMVAFYHFTGLTRYDAGRLTLYLFSAVVGSVVCTNALCFEAQRVRRALADGESIWRLLVAKNLALAALITVAGLPVIALLTVLGDGNPIAMIDQLVTMVFIWLGVGNVLSVVYPLRHEPVSARFSDGTLVPYLFSFAVSYGVGLTVNLMIYWRLWSRQSAARELVGGDFAAFALVLASAITSWVLLTVFAVACSREPRVRRVLSREMIPFQKG